jgi:hypothetical protein
MAARLYTLDTLRGNLRSGILRPQGKGRLLIALADFAWDGFFPSFLHYGPGSK